MAKPRASAIPKEKWERHKEEIVSLYRESELESVMQLMKERHGFYASKNQYPGMLKNWGIRKNTRNNDWKRIYKCTRKRQSTGKPTNYFLYGKGISLKGLEAKFGKYITFTENLYIAEDDDASIPDGFAILTPPAEAALLSLDDRAVKIDNLPWILFNKESQLQLLLWQSFFDSANFMAVDNSDMSSHQIYYQGLESLEACHAQQSLVPSYPGTFGFDNMSLNFECMFDPLPDMGSSYLNTSLNSLPIDPLFSVSLKIILEKASTQHLHTSLESIYKTYMVEDNRVENYPAMILSAHSNPTVYQLFSLFIFMVTNNLLHMNSIRGIYVWANSNSCNWIFAEILKLKSTTIDVFATKLLPAAVHVGDSEMIRILVSRNVDIDTPINTTWATKPFRTALSLAVGQRNVQMIKLLCDLGATPKIHEADSWANSETYIASLWSYQSIQILRLLLDYGADPDSLVSNCPPGYPLIKAASEGNIEAVNLLVAAKANVNLSISKRWGTALQTAAANGHVQVARALLKAKADANMACSVIDETRGLLSNNLPPCQTPIQLAAKANNTEIAILLLQSGALVNFCPILTGVNLEWIDTVSAESEYLNVDSRDETLPFAFAIQYAAQNGNFSLVHYLLGAGAMVDSRIGVDQGSTPLQIAARLGNVELISLLLANNANVNAPPGKYNGRTAIQAAAENGNVNIIQLLLDAHAEVNASPGRIRGRTALQAALEQGHINAARRLLLAGAYINASPGFSKGLTELQAAVSFGDIEIVEELLSYGADINAAAGPEKGLTALQAAVKCRNIDLLELLLQKGADVNALPSKLQNKTALQYAVFLEWMEGVQLLLDYNPDVRMLPPYDDYDSFSALGWAINNRDHDMIVLLLDHGAEPNDPVVNCQGPPPTAFLYALNSLDSYEIIELLVKRGADIFQCWGSKSALDIAITCLDVNVEIVQKIIGLISEAATGNHFDASFRNSLAIISAGRKMPADIKLIQILLDAGADINAKEMDCDVTILQDSAMYGAPEVIRFLLQHGAEVNVPATTQIGTPLQQAIKYQEHTDIAYLLLEYGADVNALPAERRGLTALQATAIRGYLPLARRLLERGADVTAAPAPIDGRTAIDGAAEHGHLDMLQLLLNAYGDREGLAAVCNQAASFADKEGHAAIALWLRGYAAS